MSQHTIWFESDLTCKPLDSLKDIQSFLFEPPAWRTLCEPLCPHSDRLIRNCELNANFNDITLEQPQNFCHVDPDKEHVARHDKNTLPKTLVCHDMANGYHDDCAIDGTTDHTAYTFYNWAVVDIFCYFSHHLITIPPLGWINVAHHHGVKVIGTVITEWAEGSLFWNKILPSETETQNMVSALVTIAKTLKFEGWLLNVENKISVPDKLIDFVRRLHTMLHEEVPGAVLIWYDSVTEDGNLNWQNKLNEKNRVWFEACDGLFTNYSWDADDVRDSAAAAGDRRTDVYVGVDVWGRNFYGGGKFNTQEAVKLIHSMGLSLAIFAPAWTHEAMDDQSSRDQLSLDKAEVVPPDKMFLLRERALWDSLWPYLNTHVPCQMPFQTSFCLGLGIKRRMYGEVLCNSPWYNLRHQQYQPNSNHGGHGYLLSTNENIKKVSRHTVRDIRGIMRYRQSLMNLNRLDDTDEGKTESSSQDEDTRDNHQEEDHHNTDTDEDHGGRVRSVQHDSMTILHDVDNKESKLKNVFRNLFRMKKTKVEFKESAANQLSTNQSSTNQSSTNELNTELSAGNHSEHQSASHDDVGGAHSNLELRPAMSLQGPPVMMRVGGGGRTDSTAAGADSGGGARTRLVLVVVPEERDCIEIYLQDSFMGGSCLKIHPSDHISSEHRTIQLFHTDFHIADTLVICFVVKSVMGFASQYLNLYVDVDCGVSGTSGTVSGTSGTERHQRVVLVGRQVAHECDISSDTTVIKYPMHPDDDDFKELQAYLVVHEPGFYVPVKNAYGWKVFYFQLKMAGCSVPRVCARPGLGQGAVLLGHIGLCSRDTRSVRARAHDAHTSYQHIQPQSQSQSAQTQRHDDDDATT